MCQQWHYQSWGIFIEIFPAAKKVLSDSSLSRKMLEVVISYFQIFSSDSFIFKEFILLKLDKNIDNFGELYLNSSWLLEGEKSYGWFSLFCIKLIHFTYFLPPQTLLTPKPLTCFFFLSVCSLLPPAPQVH